LTPAVNDFVRVTELKGRIHWVNLAHVRRLTVRPPVRSDPVVTEVHIDSSFVETVLVVVETPEDILAQRRA
jgi:hypothetical protein